MRWLDVLAASRPSDLYGVSVLKDAPASLAAPALAFKPYVDTHKMAVTAVLTTSNPDRQGDIIDPSGGDFSEHETNPVVMFHHGKQHKLPIGKAEDAKGNYTVRLVPHEDAPVLLGTTHFAQSNRFANDVFGLVAEDVLRGVSIGFDPIDGDDSIDELGPSPVLKRPALHFKGWKLLEYSHTPIGVNRDALTVAVQKALDGSRQLDPRLLAMLKPLAQPRREIVTSGYEKGCTVDVMNGKPMPSGKVKGVLGRANTNTIKGKKKPIPPAKVEKAMPQDDDDDADDTQLPTSDDDDDTPDDAASQDDDGDPGEGADFDPTSDDPSADPALAENGMQPPTDDEPPPPTVQTLTDGAQGLLDLCAAVQDGMKKSEHMKGRKFASKLCDDLRKMAGEVTQFAQKVQSELSANPMGDDADDTADTAPGDDGDNANPKEPETDEEGAIVAKGYSPRRWTYADLAGSAPAHQPAANPNQLKALQQENAQLRKSLKTILDDIEAGNGRDR